MIRQRRERRTRLWVCPCCRHTIRRRRRDDTTVPTCLTCREKCIAARTWPTQVACLHRRAVKKVRGFQERYGAQPRTQSLRRINSGGELSRLWAQVRKAKNRGSLLRRSERWVHALQDYCNDAKPDSGRWKRRVTAGTHGVIESKEQQSYSPITFTFVDSLPGAHGMWRRSPLRGIYDIRIARRATLDEMRDTIIHEALHMIDDMAGLEDGGHGSLWAQRLAVMVKKFPTKEFGTR